MMPKDCFKTPFVRAVLFRLLIPLQLLLVCVPAQADYWEGLAVSPIYSNSASGFSSNEEGAQAICDDVWEVLLCTSEAMAGGWNASRIGINPLSITGFAGVITGAARRMIEPTARCRTTIV